MFSFRSRFVTYFVLFISINMTDSSRVTLVEASRATPLHDGQGCWYDVLSPTQVLTAEEKLDHNMNQQQQQQEQEQVNKDTMMMEKKKKKKTKKCRGNRKEQQRRRRQRRQAEKKAMKQNNEEVLNNMDQDMTVPDDGQDERMEVSGHLCRNAVVIIDNKFVSSYLDIIWKTSATENSCK